MDLLEERLPEPRVKPDVALDVFFDRCESIANTSGWGIDRRRKYAGPGYEQLNIHLATQDPGYPMLRMVATPRHPQHLTLDVVAQWKTRPIEYDEYVEVLHASYDQLLEAYKKTFGKRLRLSVPRRPPTLDMATVNCNRIRYAAEKFSELMRTYAIGEGDARTRLINSFSTFHVIRPDDLPQPLREHLQGVYDEITRRPARHRLEGSVGATVSTMKNATAARIIERVLDIADAVQVIEKACNGRRAPASTR